MPPYLSNPGLHEIMNKKQKEHIVDFNVNFNGLVIYEFRVWDPSFEIAQYPNHLQALGC